ncbi:hypothetical protein [Amycolatopsis australiensis]|uniref:hypothetical protein n=1 Tax=Amycolatopsis australiensis TaxID=546364 RepID=UPI001160E5E4|nr:hypothetical protein [Amycolatopsis australiensis]
MAGSVALAGWTIVGHFLVEPLVPAPVMAGILLGGCTVGIFLAAFLGSRRGRRDRQDRRTPRG